MVHHDDDDDDDDDDGDDDDDHLERSDGCSDLNAGLKTEP